MAQTYRAPRVLHLIGSLDVGGTESQLVQFINRSSNPLSHRVATFHRAGPLAADLPTDLIRVGTLRRSPLGARDNVRVLREVRRVVRELGIDLVHAHHDLSELIAAISVPRFIPIVAARRGQPERFATYRGLRILQGLAHRRIEVMVCNSSWVAEYTREHDHWCPPTLVIHNAVDLERFRRADLPTLDHPEVVVVASLKPIKRQDLILQAVRSVARELPRTQLTFVGEGPDRARLEAMALDLGLERNVRFVGQVLDVLPHLRAAHVVALSSVSEGFPNALLEGMAVGRPVVATAVGGIPELVRDGVDGLLVPPDPKAMATALLRLLNDPRLLARMAENASERAAAFGWDRLVEDMEGVYHSLVAQRRYRGPSPSHSGDFDGSLPRAGGAS